MDCLLYNKDPMGLIKNKNSYFKNTSPECSLFSQDNHEIAIHKELFYQTKLMREMIMNVGFDSKIELICPSLSKAELETIVYFLYEGKILCSDQSAVSQVSQNLTDLFGFPLIQGEIFDTKESIFLPSPTKKKPRKSSRKHSLQERSMDPIGDYFPEATIKIERDIDKEDWTAVDFKDELEPDIKIEEEEEDPLFFDQANDPSENEEKPFSCKFCNHRCAKKSGIVDHIRQHHEGWNPKVAIVKCPICEKELTSKSMKKHMWSLHGKKRPYTCDLCGLSFAIKATWKAHVNQKYSCKNRLERTNERNTLKGKINRSCPVCEEVFESKALKIKHIAEKHPERNIYGCLFCEMKCLSIRHLHLHLSQKHEKEHGPDIYSSLPVPKGSRRICPICKRVFKTRTKVMEHYTLVHPEAQIYNCSLCEERYLTLNGLNRHIFFSHERKVTDLGCSFCGKEFTLKQELQDHIATDHKEKKYECLKCEASYSGIQSLQSHIEKVHEMKKYQCTTCGEVFETITKLESHVALKHDRTKLFKCPSCNATYLTKKVLDDHISFVHNKSTGHLCPECGENFQQRRGMKEHILVVHEGKGFDCQFCNKTFNTGFGRQSHIRKIHEGKKPQPEKCSQCDKTFVNGGTLKKHTEAVHEKKRPYACHLCDLSFTQSGNLRTHIKGKHKEFIFTGKVKNGSFLPG